MVTPAEATIEKIRTFCVAGLQSMSVMGRMDALADVLAIIEENRPAMTANKGPRNALENELFDLITLMPDNQTQRIIDYILTLRTIRAAQSNDTNP
jgi:hypothetical protein